MINHSYQLHTLANGLNVILVPMDGVRSLTVLAMVGTGSRFETPKTAGISHFLEHMVFKGTKRFPTARELASAIDAVGAEFNAYTSKEYTGYYVKSASEHVELSLDVVSDMLLAPKLRHADMEREKGVIVEEIHMYEDTPMRHIGDIFENVMFAGSPLGRDVIGSEETVREFTRKDFERHLATWYGLKNVCFVIAGDSGVVSDKKLLMKIEKAFAKQSPQRSTEPTQNYVRKLVDNPLSQDHKLRVEYKDTQQAHFIMAFPGVKRTDPDKYALSILATLLGGNMSSRLFTEVREKRGLCYYVHSEMDSYHETGLFGASAGVDPARVDEAVKVVREQLLLLLSDKKGHQISLGEVERAKSHVVGSTILQFEDCQTVAQSYAMGKLLQDHVETVEDKLKKLQAVSLDDVRRVAKRLVKPEDLYFALIGPYKDAGRFAKIFS